MLAFLPSFVIGPLSALIIAGNTVLVFIPFAVLGILKLCLPMAGARLRITRWLEKIAEGWISVNNLAMDLTQNHHWDVQGLGGLAIDDLEYDDWYLVLSNHRSSADIFVLQRVFNRRIPFLKFFLKQELIWVPLIGFAWWALDLPFMKRYSRAYLEKHPEKRGVDIETTRKACSKFRQHPSAIINFLEGTRFSQKSQQKQASPFDHLLLPRAGGIGNVLSIMGDKIEHLLDVTIAYPQNSRSNLGFWDYLSGRITHVVVRVERVKVPEEFRLGDYAADPDFRARFQAWVNERWAAKDQLLRELIG